MILKIFVLLSFMYMLVMNYLANSIPFGGNTTGDISSKYPTMFTPSGFTFSIWGLIYLLVTLFVVLLFTKSSVVLPEDSTRILLLFIALNVLNGTWLLAWHNDFQVLATIIIVMMLLTLLMMLAQLDKTQYLTYLTFSIYAGWISIATIANITIVLYKLNLGIFINNEPTWFYLILIIGVVIAGIIFLKTKNIPYVSVYAWAYFGILMKYIN